MNTPTHRPAVPRLRVHTPDGRERLMLQSFHVGRSADCDVQIDDAHVSRKHLAVSIQNGRWCFRDLQSANGVFMNGSRVETAAIDERTVLQLGGLDGPVLTLE